MSRYTLNVVSKHPKFMNGTLQKYYVDKIETIGVWGNEAFEITLSNNSRERIQTRISLDGVDILTGELATTNATGPMWLVEPYQTLRLNAWQESSKGGASFVFTNSDNSVSLNVHNSTSHRGIISAAVYEEGYTEPFRTTMTCKSWNVKASPCGCSSNTKCARSFSKIKLDMNDTLGEVAKSCDTSDTTCYNSETGAAAASSTFDFAPELRSEASVGAGSYVDQNVKYVKGFTNPKLVKVVKLRYLWWDDLKKKLLNYQEDPHPTGFPGDELNGNFVNLKNTPRLDTEFKRVC